MPSSSCKSVFVYGACPHEAVNGVVPYDLSPEHPIFQCRMRRIGEAHTQQGMQTEYRKLKNTPEWRNDATGLREYWEEH